MCTSGLLLLLLPLPSPLTKSCRWRRPGDASRRIGWAARRRSRHSARLGTSRVARRDPAPPASSLLPPSSSTHTDRKIEALGDGEGRLHTAKGGRREDQPRGQSTTAQRVRQQLRRVFPCSSFSLRRRRSTDRGDGRVAAEVLKAEQLLQARPVRRRLVAWSSAQARAGLGRGD